MTQIFAEDGTVTPVTVIKAGPCVVVQTKSAAGRDGYNAVQLGLVEDKPVRLKNVTKPLRGHFEKTGGGFPPTRVLKEIRLTGEPEAAVGDQVKVDLFADGDKIEVVGKSKGRGFAGTIKRHKFQSRSRVARFDERSRAGFDRPVGLSVARYQGNAFVGPHGRCARDGQRTDGREGRC